MIDSPLFTNFIFYPRKEKLPSNLNNNFIPLRFPMPDGIQLSSLFIKINSSKPCILLFHGNGEIVNDYLNFYEIYTSTTGFNICIVDYRGYGESEGKPFYSSLFKDPLHVYDQLRKWLNDHDINQQQIVFGRSLGSVCASVIGSKNPNDLKGVVIESGISNLYELTKDLAPQMAQSMDDGVKEELDKWSNDKLISKITVPTLIIHGEKDTIVPFYHAEKNVALIKKAEFVIFQPISNAGHNNIMSFNEYKQSLVEFSSRL